MEFPLISVIVTTYNYAHTVGTAIESALRQDYPNLEVVVVDNASTDGTPALMERYRAERRVRYLRNDTNIGMVPNHNKGLAEARGTYVLFLSADDFLMPDHVSRSYWYLVAHPEVDVLYTTAYFVDAQERFFGVRQMSGQPPFGYAGGRNEFAALLVEGCYMCFPTMLMRRDLFERFGPLDEEIKAADYEIVVRWAANGVRFGYLPAATCAVRLHPDQQSSTQNYVADAGDLREFIYLLRKFAEQHADRLRDWEMSISRHLWTRLSMAQQAGVVDEDGSLRAAIDASDLMLSAIRTRNRALPRRLHPTIVVLGARNVADMARTFGSLIAQTHEDWDAIAIEAAGFSYEDLGNYLDPRGRIRAVRPITTLSESQSINAGLRIAEGDVFLVVRAGNEWTPDTLAAVVDALRRSGADAVRIPARLRIDGAGDDAIYDPYMDPTEAVLPWTVPFGPMEAFAFTRSAVDARSSLSESLGLFAEWEFFLRVAASLNVISLHHGAAIVHAEVGEAGPFARFSQLPIVARALYQRYAASDPAIADAREAYLQRLTDVLALGPDQCSTVDGLVRLHAVACAGNAVAVPR